MLILTNMLPLLKVLLSHMNLSYNRYYVCIQVRGLSKRVTLWYVRSYYHACTDEFAFDNMCVFSDDTEEDLWHG